MCTFKPQIMISHMNTDNADLSHSSLRESVFLPMKMNGMERLKILFVLYNDEQ